MVPFGMGQKMLGVKISDDIKTESMSIGRKTFGLHDIWSTQYKKRCHDTKNNDT
jgi:hypothetical protein